MSDHFSSSRQYVFYDWIVQLKELAALHELSVLTEDEFHRQKALILRQSHLSYPLMGAGSSGSESFAALQRHHQSIEQDRFHRSGYQNNQSNYQNNQPMERDPLHGPTVASKHLQQLSHYLKQLNPLAHMVGVYRELILNDTFPHPHSLIIIMVMGALSLLIGYSVFHHHQSKFADLV